MRQFGRLLLFSGKCRRNPIGAFTGLYGMHVWTRSIKPVEIQSSAGHDNYYDDVIMNAMASQMTSHMIDYSTVYSDANQRKHQSSASLAFALGIHRGPVNFPHKWPVTRKKFPFHDVIMDCHRNVMFIA